MAQATHLPVCFLHWLISFKADFKGQRVTLNRRDSCHTAEAFTESVKAASARDVRRTQRTVVGCDLKVDDAHSRSHYRYCRQHQCSLKTR